MRKRTPTGVLGRDTIRSGGRAFLAELPVNLDPVFRTTLEIARGLEACQSWTCRILVRRTPFISALAIPTCSPPDALECIVRVLVASTIGRLGIAFLVGLTATTAACRHASAPPPARPGKVGESRERAPRPPPPPEWFWEDVEVDRHAPAREPVELPLTARQLSLVEGARAVWDDLSPDARERFLKDGVLVIPTTSSKVLEHAASPIDRPGAPPRERSMGAFYTDLREQRVPHLITLDALFSVVHLGIERSLADVEESEIAPLLHDMLERLEARLRTEASKNVGTELAEGYRLALGVTAVARSLEAGRSRDYAPPPALASIVADERAHIEGHAGLVPSPLFGTPLDYTRFAVPGAPKTPNAYRTLRWLSAASFTLVGRGEAEQSHLSLAQARTNARAAMLLARACSQRVDAEVYADYTKLLRLFSFIWGPPDDLTLLEIDQLATSAGVNIEKPENVRSVVRVDKVRARALAGRAPSGYDASAGVGRAGVSARIFGGHASIDSLVLGTLVGTVVGSSVGALAPSSRTRDGHRVIPSTLDIAAWLGAPEARAALHESHADAFDRYDEALTGLVRTRPSMNDNALHASVYGSLVDVLIAWATPAPPPAPIHDGAPRARAQVESMLSAWTLVRHTGSVFTRTPRRGQPDTSSELHVSGTALPVYVSAEPLPIARLVAATRQLRRGLEATTSLKAGAPAITSLVELEDMLRAALTGAAHHADDTPLSPEEASALASLPARLARFEDDPNAQVDAGPVVSVVYADPTGQRLLATATGRVEPILLLAREPGKAEPLLVVGAHLPHYELLLGESLATPGIMHGAQPPIDDISWRAELDRTTREPATFTAKFRWSPPPKVDGAATQAPTAPAP